MEANATTTPTIKLVRTGNGLSSYATPDHQYRVIQH
jgi:hypothetical protein